MKTDSSKDKSMDSTYDLSSQRFYHGTKTNLKPGDLIEPGFNSNYGKRKKASYIYLTATLDAAIWGAELAMGEWALGIRFGFLVRSRIGKGTLQSSLKL